MRKENVLQIIRETAYLRLHEINLSHLSLTHVTPEIMKLTEITEINLSHNKLTQLPSEIIELSHNELTQLSSEITKKENLTTLDLSHNEITSLSKQIEELKDLTTLNLSNNQLIQLPSEIGELKNLTTLNLSNNQLIQLPSEIGELKSLTTLNLSNNQLVQLPSEIGELKNLTTLDLSYNQLTLLPSEIGELKNLTIINLINNMLTYLPSGIKEYKLLTKLDLSDNRLIQLPNGIGELKNLTKLILSNNRLKSLPSEIGELQNLKELDLSYNQLTRLPLEIGELKNLTTFILSYNHLFQLPPEIGKLKNLRDLDLFSNQLTQLPIEIGKLTNLTMLKLKNNYITSPPPEIVSRGLEAIFIYLRNSKTTENNEAKLILVGNGDVGKTCLANRLIYDEFLEDATITEGINISKWETHAPGLENTKIKLNIWDFGGQEIYHATHQFFLTRRSVYILVWNARKTKDYDHIYYWLHTIGAFGEDSPIILVMSKMNESNDDLNLKNLKSKFPQIVGYLKIDSLDGSGIDSLIETIRRTAWDLPLMRSMWVDSWFKVRQRLEDLKRNWISYDKFIKICKSEGLDIGNINVLDDYLNDLGVTLHFKDRLTLRDIVILKPEWATNAFYKILSTKFVLDNEGILSQSDLSQIWDTEVYPFSVHSQLMELMNKFELAYELPDKSRYLVAELLPKSEPDFTWDEKDNLCFYYRYEYFLPSSIMTRFIVRMHKEIVKKEDGMPLCWREGAVLQLQYSRVLVKMKPDEKQIEIKIKGDNKRGALGAICHEIDQINASTKKTIVSKEIPCDCSTNCSWRYPYEKLLIAEMNNIPTIQCFESYMHVPISLLLDGYKKREERHKGYKKTSRHLESTVIFKPKIVTNFEAKQIMEARQNINVDIDVNIELKIGLPQIQTDFDKLRREIKNLDPDLKSEMDEIQDRLDEVTAEDERSKLKKPFNMLRRLLVNLGDSDSDHNKIINGTEKGIELTQKVIETFNRIAPLLGIALLHGIH